jgi:type IV secretion/conjugal transfer VirB4 family ATPase
MGFFVFLVLAAFGGLGAVIFHRPKRRPQRLYDYLPWAYFTDGYTIITKDGRLLAACRLVPHDFAYADGETINEALGHLNRSFAELGSAWTYYIDSRRCYRPVPPFRAKEDCINAVRDFELERLAAIGEYFYNELYLVMSYRLPQQKSSKDFLLGGGSLQRELGHFGEVVQSNIERYRNAFKEVIPLDKDGLCTYLHGTVSARHHPVKAPTAEWPLDRYLADVRFRPDIISKIDESYIFTIALHDFPAATEWQLISSLFLLNIDFRLVSRFNFLDQKTAKSLIDSHRRALFSGAKGMRDRIAEMVTEEESPMSNPDAEALAEEAGVAVGTLAQGVNYGYLTASVIIMTPDYQAGRERVKLIISRLNKLGFVAKEETLNNPFAFLGSIPGNDTYNVRKALVSTVNFSHFWPLSGQWQGESVNGHLKELTGAEWPHLIAASDGGIFNLNLNVGDVGHTLIFGSTGSGKSILLGTLAAAWQTYPDARVVFFDKDRSSRAVCLNCGGHFYDLGDGQSDLRLNPFWLAQNEEDRGWLVEFLVGYLKNKIAFVSSDYDKAVREAVVSMAALPPATLGFGAFCSSLQNAELRDIFKAFADDYTFIFTAGDDRLDTLTHFQVFEMNELMQRSKELAQFCLGYLFRRLSKNFTGEPTLLILDEAWLFLDSPYFAATIRDWLKTLRKKNVYVIMATQELNDAAESPIFATIAASCETKILLPNREAFKLGVRELYERLGLTEGDLAAISTAVKKQDYYYISPKGRQLFQLGLTHNNLQFLKEVSL